MKEIPRKEFKFIFTKSSGPGGQNVNKVNSKVSLYWDYINSEFCNQGIKKRFAEKYQRYIVDDKVVITSQRYRNQGKNIEDCILKLHTFLASVKSPPVKRIATRPSRNAIKRRLDEKKKHSSKKRERSEKF